MKTVLLLAVLGTSFASSIGYSAVSFVQEAVDIRQVQLELVLN